MSARSKPYGATRKAANGSRVFFPDTDAWEAGEPALDDLWPGDVVYSPHHEPGFPRLAWVVTSELEFNLL